MAMFEKEVELDITIAGAKFKSEAFITFDFNDFGRFNETVHLRFFGTFAERLGEEESHRVIEEIIDDLKSSAEYKEALFYEEN